MKEGRRQVFGLVGRRGRFLWKVYHIGCPLLVEVEVGCDLGVYASSGIMLSLCVLRRSFIF